MYSEPLVSVITPCYNGADYLDDFFSSLLSQTYKNIEIIFINDGSEDDTVSIALKYKEKFEELGIRFVYINQENSGQSHAINVGLKFVKGEYMVWPDSDDILDKTSIELRVNFLNENPSYDIVRSNGYVFRDTDNTKLCRLSNLKNRFNEDIFEDLINEKTYCVCGAYMIRISALKCIYPNLELPESPAGQNWQILIPITGNSKCGFIDEDLYFVRSHDDSHSRRYRTPSEQKTRFEQLKQILLLSIEASGRKDKDYAHLVELKYYRQYFIYFLAQKDKYECKYYLKMLKHNEQNIEDLYMHYLRVFRPMCYNFMCLIYSIKKRFKCKINVEG